MPSSQTETGTSLPSHPAVMSALRALDERMFTDQMNGCDGEDCRIAMNAIRWAYGLEQKDTPIWLASILKH
jgi:hypothetical protein